MTQSLKEEMGSRGFFIFKTGEVRVGFFASGRERDVKAISLFL